jgi:hypothetical protein
MLHLTSDPKLVATSVRIIRKSKIFRKIWFLGLLLNCGTECGRSVLSLVAVQPFTLVTERSWPSVLMRVMQQARGRLYTAEPAASSVTMHLCSYVGAGFGVL